MTKSDQIRFLAASGMSVADIARKVGIRYQHAYNVLKAGSVPRVKAVADVSADLRGGKILLTKDVLIQSGFLRAGSWLKDQLGELQVSDGLPKESGVYAFATSQQVLYVGVATMGLSKRLYFYRKPGKSQTTSIRIRKLLLDSLAADEAVEIYTACPPNLDWNGLRVNGAAGLEVGIIECFHLPWNIRGANKRGAG